MAAVGPVFGLTRLAAIRSGLLLAPGGEFAFVAFGEAVARGVLPAAVCNLLYVVRKGRGGAGREESLLPPRGGFSTIVLKRTENEFP
jgi:hypothetical protein